MAENELIGFKGPENYINMMSVSDSGWTHLSILIEPRQFKIVFDFCLLFQIPYTS